MATSRRFRALLQEAVDYFARTGYTSEGDLQRWLARLHLELDHELPDDTDIRTLLTNALGAIHSRATGARRIEKLVPGVQRYTLERVAPKLRGELDKRIYAGVDLIKLNRQATIEKTLQRFAGWVSSVPPAGLAKPDRRAIVSEIGKGPARLKFEARRVVIDQGHKLNAAVSHVVAMGEGAIAGIWHDRGQEDANYDARPEHLARSGKLFLVRDSWAFEQGLIKKGGLEYTDEFEQPAELPFCSCFYEYIVSPRRIPAELLTAKGQMWIKTGTGAVA